MNGVNEIYSRFMTFLIIDTPDFDELKPKKKNKRNFSFKKKPKGNFLRNQKSERGTKKTAFRWNELHYIVLIWVVDVLDGV